MGCIVTPRATATIHRVPQGAPHGLASIQEMPTPAPTPLPAPMPPPSPKHGASAAAAAAGAAAGSHVTKKKGKKVGAGKAAAGGGGNGNGSGISNPLFESQTTAAHFDAARAAAQAAAAGGEHDAGSKVWGRLALSGSGYCQSGERDLN